MILAITSGLCVFIHSSLNKKMHSFHKRFFVLSLCIILAFTTISKPREVKAFAISLTTVCGIIAAASGIVVMGHELYTWWKEIHPEDSEDDCLEYFKNNISVDGDGNYVLTDDAKLTINNMMDSYNDTVTYVNARFPTSNDIMADQFDSLKSYTLFQTIVSKYPNKVFQCAGLQNTYYYGMNGTSYILNVFDMPLGGVSAYTDLAALNVSLYDDNWSNDISYKTIYIFDAFDQQFIFYRDRDGDLTNEDSYFRFDTVEELDNFSFDDVTLSHKASFNACLGVNTQFSNIKFSDYSCFSDFVGKIPVYQTLADLKNGTALGVEGNYIPSYYTGQSITNNIVDSHDVSNVINNYYDNDPDNPGGGDDDSGSVLTGFLGAIGKLGEAILKILNTLIGIIADAVKVVTGGFTAVTDLIQNGFSDFLASLFPYIPKEWVACITLSLSLLVFGVVIKLFTK